MTKSNARYAGLNRVQVIDRLTAPGKMTRRDRKILMSLFEIRVFPTQEAIPAPVKFARKLTTLSMAQLIRRQKKFARESSTAKHLLDKMMPGPSRLRFAMQARHDEHLGCFKQVTAEIKARLLAVEGRLAEAAANE